MSGRLQIASMSVVVISAFAFILTICLVLFEDQWVTGIVSNFRKTQVMIRADMKTAILLFRKLTTRKIQLVLPWVRMTQRKKMRKLLLMLPT